MISVCIPVYNFKITKLINDLTSCFINSNLDYELLIIDDASFIKHKQSNSFLKEKEIPKIKYIELDKNIGRAAIRNLFLNYAAFECLLYLDCDSIIPDKDFIAKYWQVYCDDADIICGGRIYENKPAKTKYKLRWKYGKKRECFPASIRKKHPFYSFMTNNFMIRKEVFKKVQFNEKLVSYGHEDSLFGYQLSKYGFEIVHIDNPTIHDFNETAQEFLNKTKEGIINLHFINTKILPKGEFASYNKLLSIYCKIEKYKLKRLFYLLSLPALPFLGILLRTPFVFLPFFDAYKFLFLSKVSLNKNKLQKD